jgi:hypothetical protein
MTHRKTQKNNNKLKDSKNSKANYKKHLESKNTLNDKDY